MNLLDSLADFAVGGRIGGAGIHATPADWQQVLGDDFVDDRAKARFRRDYGLVELGFWRTDGDWRCNTVSIQLHRLWWHRTTGLAGLLHEDFPRSVAFTDLREALANQGRAPTMIADADTSEVTRFVVPGSAVVILVLSEGGPVKDGPSPGAVWSLALSDNAEAWIRPRM